MSYKVALLPFTSVKEKAHIQAQLDGMLTVIRQQYPRAIDENCRLECVILKEYTEDSLQTFTIAACCSSEIHALKRVLFAGMRDTISPESLTKDFVSKQCLPAVISPMTGQRIAIADVFVNEYLKLDPTAKLSVRHKYA